MTPKSPHYVLEVLDGPDVGARLDVVGATPRSIGRSVEADLPLRDPTVSRRHVEALATPNGVQLVASAGATRIVVDGRLVARADVAVGQTVVVGKTRLKVSLATGHRRSKKEEGSQTDVVALLTGPLGDARGLANVYTLVEALDQAESEAALESVLRKWASDQDVASHVAIVSEDAEAAPGGARESDPKVLEVRDRDHLILTVPTSSAHASRLAFTLTATRVTNSQRRVLVVAARIFASAFERVRRAELAAQEREELRTLHYGSARGFLGESAAAKHLAGLIPKLAASDVSVLLEGETGVGKTFFARLIHETSPRAREPLRVINCASIPETLLESELFGHERGAFTGATAGRAGALESAGAGTLFLDEIGELSMASQAKLLRALEERRFERVGSNRTLDLRARVLCATNRDLATLAKEGDFRADLLFRISVVKLTIPPLRERGEDLVLLAKRLLGDAVATAHRRVEGFSDAALGVIRAYPWPGNVRELRNAIEHAIVLGDERDIQPSDLPAGIQARASDPPDRGSLSLLNDAVGATERKTISEALRAAGGNRTRAAALLGVSRVTLYNKLRKL